MQPGAAVVALADIALVLGHVGGRPGLCVNDGAEGAAGGAADHSGGAGRDLAEAAELVGMQPLDGGGDRAPVAAPVDQADVGQRVGGDDLVGALAEVANLGLAEGHGLGLQPGPGVVDAFQPDAFGAVGEPEKSNRIIFFDKDDTYRETIVSLNFSR